MDKNNGAGCMLIPMAVVGGAMFMAMVASRDVLALVLFGVLALCILLMIVMAIQSDIQNKKNKQQVMQEKARQVQIISDFTAMLNGYLQNPCPTQRETREIWEKCQNLLADYGVLKAGAVFQIFCEVREWMKLQYCRPAPGYSSADLYALVDAFAKKLLEFYYRVAFTYDLAPDDQDNLLRYLWSFLSQAGAYACQDNPGYISYQRDCIRIDIDRADWDKKRLLLLEEGYRKQSAYATFLLANCYYNNHLVAFRDYDMAFSLYRHAIRFGSINAIYALGECYEYGRGTGKDYQKAGDCYRYAFDLTGDRNYAEALDKLYVANKWDKDLYSPDIFDENGRTAGSGNGILNKDNLKKLKEQLIDCARMDMESGEMDVAAFRVRKILEEVVNAFVECYADECMQETLLDKISLLQNRGYFTAEIAHKAHIVRKVGNRGVHEDGETLTPNAMRKAIVNLQQILNYYEQY